MVFILIISNDIHISF